MLDFKDLISLQIDEPDKEAFEKTARAWDQISKPIDGLGDFEKLICRIAAIQGTERPDISKRAALILTCRRKVHFVQLRKINFGLRE